MVAAAGAGPCAQITSTRSFAADPEVLDLYADAVKYVEERYYLKVSRYATSAFLRLRLGHELGWFVSADVPSR